MNKSRKIDGAAMTGVVLAAVILGVIGFLVAGFTIWVGARLVRDGDYVGYWEAVGVAVIVSGLSMAWNGVAKVRLRVEKE